MRNAAYLATILAAPLLLRAAGSRPVQQAFCQSDLVAAPGHPQGYRDRGTRCEGVYAREVGSTTLLVAGLGDPLAAIDSTAGAELLLRWTAPTSTNPAPVQIRGLGLERRLYYRMDTRQPAAAGRFAWSTDVLRALHLDGRRIGLLAWIDSDVGGQRRRLHLPLRIGSAGDVRTQELVVLPGRELAEVYVSIARLRPDGSPDRVLREGKPLAYGYYPSERPIRIALPEAAGPGLYLLEVGADIRGGGSSAVELLVFQAEG